MALLSDTQTEKAVKALLQHVKITTAVQKQQESSTKQLFDEDLSVWIVVATKKIAETTKITPHKIPLAHPLINEESEICLLTKDPQSDYKKLVKDQQINGVKKVIGITKLRQKYKPYEAKRLLCDSYDMFLADERVLPLLPKLLGKTFFAKKKLPLAVNLQKKDLKAEIQSAMSCTYYYPSTGASSSIRIGRVSQSPEQIVENVLKATDKIVDRIPRKWDNIQSIHIKTNDSVALPIYIALPDKPKPKKQPLQFTEEERAAFEEKKKLAKIAKAESKKRLNEEMQIFDPDSNEDSLFMKKLLKKIKLEV